MDADREQVPIEEPIEIIVGPEITLETISTCQLSDVDAGYHDNKDESSGPAEQASNLINESIIQSTETFQKGLEHSVNPCKEERENSKRLRDMLKKRARRQDQEYRKTESMKAKERMANRRNDPAYRELERQRDRERRAKARKDEAFREKERERDRLYKQKQSHLISKKEVQGVVGKQKVEMIILKSTVR